MPICLLIPILFTGSFLKYDYLEIPLKKKTFKTRVNSLRIVARLKVTFLI